MNSNKKEILTLLCDILTFITQNNISPLKNYSSKELQAIQRAEGELLKNFREKAPTLNKLARIAGMNRQKFQELFKDVYGNSFYQYYQIARFEYAKKLIEQNGYNSSEAANAIGFKNYSHFSRIFVKLFGLKPSTLKHD